jgi:anti-sigma B factor antagonist
MEATTAGDARQANVRDAACASRQASSPSIPFSIGVVWPAQGLAVVVPRGEIDAFTAPRFKDAVAGCLNDSAGALVIDLSWVSFLDASGLTVAVYAARRLGAGRTAIVCPFPHIVRVFRICGLERVLAICESREAALRSCLIAERKLTNS